MGATVHPVWKTETGASSIYMDVMLPGKKKTFRLNLMYDKKNVKKIADLYRRHV